MVGKTHTTWYTFLHCSEMKQGGRRENQLDDDKCISESSTKHVSRKWFRCSKWFITIKPRAVKTIKLNICFSNSFRWLFTFLSIEFQQKHLKMFFFSSQWSETDRARENETAFYVVIHFNDTESRKPFVWDVAVKDDREIWACPAGFIINRKSCLRRSSIWDSIFKCSDNVH